jgi:4-hydroxybenzoate polyprenyltransferase
VTHLAAAPPRTLGTRLRLAAGDIKLAHSVFALPFAVLGAFLARPTDGAWSRFAGQLALVVVCMVCARTWAMLFNRLVDRRFDAANPRTSRRVLASGGLSPREGWVLASVSATLFVAACGGFAALFANPWPLILAVPVLAWIAFYSLTKRFTWLCHVFLGGALAVSPLAAAIAVDPAALTRTPALFFLAGMVLCWVAGFDVIYALQDTAFDRSAGLSSVPASLGTRPAIWISRGLHGAAAAMLILAARTDPRFGIVFFVAVGAVLALLIAEHVVLAKRGERGLEMAFFTLNGVISCVLGLAGVVDVLV